jgi:hypothetical protein
MYSPQNRQNFGLSNKPSGIDTVNELGFPVGSRMDPMKLNQGMYRLGDIVQQSGMRSEIPMQRMSGTTM